MIILDPGSGSAIFSHLGPIWHIGSYKEDLESDPRTAIRIQILNKICRAGSGSVALVRGPYGTGMFSVRLFEFSHDGIVVCCQGCGGGPHIPVHQRLHSHARICHCPR